MRRVVAQRRGRLMCLGGKMAHLSSAQRACLCSGPLRRKPQLRLHSNIKLTCSLASQRVNATAQLSTADLPYRLADAASQAQCIIRSSQQRHEKSRFQLAPHANLGAQCINHAADSFEWPPPPPPPLLDANRQARSRSSLQIWASPSFGRVCTEILSTGKVIRAKCKASSRRESLRPAGLLLLSRKPELRPSLRPKAAVIARACRRPASISERASEAKLNLAKTEAGNAS